MKRSLFHILNGYAHIMFTHRNVPWTVEQSGCIFSVTIAGFPVLHSAIGNGFLHAFVGFDKSYIPHMLKFCMPTFGNGRNNSKTACICRYHVPFPKYWIIPPCLFRRYFQRTNHVPGIPPDCDRLAEKLALFHLRLFSRPFSITQRYVAE